jgi:transcriptional regulator with XRE-family HTH domain
MNYSRAALGKRIQKLRQKVGLTQEQLAEKAEISPKNIGEFERGRGNPTLSSLENLAVALGITMAELFDYEFEGLSVMELKKLVCDSINRTSGEDCKLYYRLLRVLTK